MEIYDSSHLLKHRQLVLSEMCKDIWEVHGTLNCDRRCAEYLYTGMTHLLHGDSWIPGSVAGGQEEKIRIFQNGGVVCILDNQRNLWTQLCRSHSCISDRKVFDSQTPPLHKKIQKQDGYIPEKDQSPSNNLCR